MANDEKSKSSLTDIEKKVQKAKLRFFRNDSEQIMKLLGGFAYKFKWNVEDMKTDGAEGSVLLDYKNRTNGKININERFISKPNYTYGNLCALICHECLHILSRHGTRRKNRDPKIWNFACDHVVDRTLDPLKTIRFYENRYNVIPELHREIPDCNAEEAYKWIIKNKVRFQVSDNGNGTITIKDKQTGKEFVVNMQTGGVDDSSLTDEERENVRQITENLLSQARSLYQQMKQKGDTSGGFIEIMDELLNVKIPWQVLLNKCIRTNVQYVPDGRSWCRPNIYYRPLGITLPGSWLEEKKDAIGTLIVVVDTSGSVNNKTLQQFAGIIMESMQFFEKVVVLVHDVDVHQELEFKKEESQKFYDFITTEGFKGRGGTSHQPVFDKIEKEYWENDEKKDDISMIISLTDGESDIQNIYKNYKFINKLPIVFAIENDRRFKLGIDHPNITEINIDRAENEDLADVG